MFQTTKDLLYLVLGIAILVISFFFSLMLYYLVRVFREFYRSVKSLSRFTDQVNEISRAIKEKLREFTLLPLLSEAIRMVIEFLKERRGKKEKKEKREE